ncbi:MAG: extracellular solute-binding protein [Nitriliruptorales bacterium]|nr:extracellular solute-binding protein [Nitriliruptorales bacterium]
MSAPSHTCTAVDLTVPPMNAVADLHGDPVIAELVLFMNGNQFMVMDELVAAFQSEHPEVRGVFFETIPPGKLVAQARGGTLQMGALRLSVAPDVVAAGPRLLQPLCEDQIIEEPVLYARNDLAILVSAGNPKGITCLADLAKPGVRIAMPNLQFEGVAELIAQALEKAGGPRLRQAVLDEKVASGETLWTQIHHRESALWLESGEVDACPLWSTEARHHCVDRGAPMETITIPPEHNVTGSYGAALVSGCAHPEAAAAFLDFIVGPDGRGIYARHGFSV